MNLEALNKVAVAMVTPGKGILAADESSGTIKKRFDAIKVESTEENRRDYREMLFRSTEAMSKYISGVILYDETIWQNAKDGTPLVKLIEQAGSIPGIKVDEGTQALPQCPGELVSVGLDKLAERLKKYYRSEEHTSELQSQSNLVCRLLLEKKKTRGIQTSLRPGSHGTTCRGGATPGAAARCTVDAAAPVAPAGDADTTQ